MILSLKYIISKLKTETWQINQGRVYTLDNNLYYALI